NRVGNSNTCKSSRTQVSDDGWHNHFLSRYEGRGAIYYGNSGGRRQCHRESMCAKLVNLWQEESASMILFACSTSWCSYEDPTIKIPDCRKRLSLGYCAYSFLINRRTT